MKLLLDTHSFLWFISNDKSLSISARSAILNDENTLYISVVSLWEMTIKSMKGALPLPGGNIQSVVEILGTFPSIIFRLNQKRFLSLSVFRSYTAIRLTAC